MISRAGFALIFPLKSPPDRQTGRSHPQQLSGQQMTDRKLPDFSQEINLSMLNFAVLIFSSKH